MLFIYGIYDSKIDDGNVVFKAMRLDEISKGVADWEDKRFKD